MSESDAADRNAQNYGVIIDAGSSGSRLFVYVWPAHDGYADHLIHIRPLLDAQTQKPVVSKISPGLSEFTGVRAANASEYMAPLLDLACRHIPEHLHAGTPLYILATAGMRLLAETDRTAIITNLRTQLPKKYKFQIVDSHIDVIDGQMEGVYSWIAVNYILGRFEHGKSETAVASQASVARADDTSAVLQAPTRDNRPDTVGMIDMGGASVQIAFEVNGRVEADLKPYVKLVSPWDPGFSNASQD